MIYLYWYLASIPLAFIYLLTLNDRTLEKPKLFLLAMVWPVTITIIVLADRRIK